MNIHDFNIENFPMDHRYELLKMAAERYLSQRIPDSRVGNDIGKIDKKPVPSIYTSLIGCRLRIENKCKIKCKVR